MSNIFYARDVIGSRTKILQYIGAYTDYDMLGDAIEIVSREIGYRDYIVELKDIKNYEVPINMYYYTYYQGIKLGSMGEFSNLTFDIGLFYSRRVMMNSPIYCKKMYEARRGGDGYIYIRDGHFGTIDENGDVFKYGKYGTGWSIEPHIMKVYRGTKRGLTKHVRGLLSKYFETRQ